MVLDRELRYTTAEQFDDFMEEYLDQFDQLKEELARTVTRVTIRYARKLARERLPSKGGSYVRTITAKRNNIGDGFTLDFFSDHQWAEAIESGTRPHEIIAHNNVLTINTFLEQDPAGVANAGYGIGYAHVTPSVKAYEVQHPGARAFWIFRDTQTYMLGQTNRLMANVIKKHGM